MIIIQNRQKSAIVPDVRKWPQTKVAVTGSLSRKKHTDQKKKKFASFHHFHTNVPLVAFHRERWRFSYEKMGDKDFPAFTEFGCIYGHCVQNDSCRLMISQAMSHRFRWWITMLISPSFSQHSNPESLILKVACVLGGYFNFCVCVWGAFFYILVRTKFHHKDRNIWFFDQVRTFGWSPWRKYLLIQKLQLLFKKPKSA